MILLNERIPGLMLTKADIHAAHRLQRDDKVIVKFVKRNVRDHIYDARFSLVQYGERARPAGAAGAAGAGRRRSPLYISESLTARNQQLYNQLLQVRKTSGGTKVASVFTRRGLVFCRTVKGGPNIRVPDEEALERIIGQAVPAQLASRDPGRGRAGGGPASGDRRRRDAPVTARRDGGRPYSRPGPGPVVPPAEGRRGDVPDGSTVGGGGADVAGARRDGHAAAAVPSPQPVLVSPPAGVAAGAAAESAVVSSTLVPSAELCSAAAADLAAAATAAGAPSTGDATATSVAAPDPTGASVWDNRGFGR